MSMPKKPPSGEGLLERLLEEAERLAAWPTSAERLLELLVPVIGLILSFSLLRRLRSSSRLALLGGLAVATVVAAVLADFVARDRPLLGLLFVAVPASAVLLHLGSRAAPWWSGIILVLSGRIRPGDFVAVGDIRGTFEGGDMFRVRIAHENGVQVYLPWSAFSGKVVSRPSDAPRLIRVPVSFSAPPAPEERRQLEVRAALCPYRVWSRPALVRPNPNHPERLDVELWSWSDEGARLTEDFLRRAARRDTMESARG